MAARLRAHATALCGRWRRRQCVDLLEAFASFLSSAPAPEGSPSIEARVARLPAPVAAPPQTQPVACVSGRGVRHLAHEREALHDSRSVGGVSAGACIDAEISALAHKGKQIGKGAEEGGKGKCSAPMAHEGTDSARKRKRIRQRSRKIE